MQKCFILIAATGECEDYQAKNISVSLDKQKLEALKVTLTEKNKILKEQQLAFRSFTNEIHENNKYPNYHENPLSNSAMQIKWQNKIHNIKTNWLKENNIQEDILGIDPDITYFIEEISLI